MGHLKNSGFVILNIPLSGVQPLQLLVKTSSGTVERLNASIEDIFIPESTEAPVVGADAVIPTIEGQEEFDMDVQANVGFLKGLVNFFNLKGKAEVSYERGEVYKIQLEHPLQNSINVVKLAGFIRDSKVNANAGSFVGNLQNDEIYIITEIIKAKSFSIERGNNQKLEASLEATIPGVANASVGSHVQQKNNFSLEYNGDTPLTFAIKASKIKYYSRGLKNDQKTKYAIESAKDLERVRAEGTIDGEPLELPNSYINLGK